MEREFKNSDTQRHFTGCSHYVCYHIFTLSHTHYTTITGFSQVESVRRANKIMQASARPTSHVFIQFALIKANGNVLTWIAHGNLLCSIVGKIKNVKVYKNDVKIKICRSSANTVFLNYQKVS